MKLNKLNNFFLSKDITFINIKININKKNIYFNFCYLSL